VCVYVSEFCLLLRVFHNKWVAVLFFGSGLYLLLVYKKYGVMREGGITRSVSGTALNIRTSRSFDVLKLKIEATLPQR
jgi:hypothetical protein